MTIKTKEPYPELKSELASPFAAIYDTQAKGKVSDQPVGTGPYQIDKYQRSQKIELSKYKDYWQGTPKLSKINVTYHEDGNTRVNHLLSGKSDITTDVPIAQINDVKNLIKRIFKVHLVSELIYYFIITTAKMNKMFEKHLMQLLIVKKLLRMCPKIMPNQPLDHLMID